MSTSFEYARVLTQGQKPVKEPTLLFMCEDSVEAEKWSKLLTSTGCAVKLCSNFVEMLLYLEHEIFHLVIILEGETHSPSWRTAAEFIAEANQGTPFFVINRMGEAAGLAPSVGSLN